MYREQISAIAVDREISSFKKNKVVCQVVPSENAANIMDCKEIE